MITWSVLKQQADIINHHVHEAHRRVAFMDATHRAEAKALLRAAARVCEGLAKALDSFVDSNLESRGAP